MHSHRYFFEEKDCEATPLPVGSLPAARKTVSLLFQFCPARVKRVQNFLRRFYLGLDSNKLGSIAGNRRVFQFSPFAL